MTTPGADHSAAHTGQIERAALNDHELGGDPACWLNQVCDECGRLIEDRFAEVCPNCGTPRDTP